MPKRMNVVELRDDLLDVYTDFRAGKIGSNEAKQASNVSGKILSSAKLQIEYNKMVQSKKRIEFLDA